MAKGFSVGDILNQKSKEVSRETSNTKNNFKIEFIELEKLYPSKKNRYSTKQIENLKASIKLSGLKQNLVVKKIGDKYEINSGHRRYKVFCELAKENHELYGKVPCKVEISENDVLTELELIFSNSTIREDSDFMKVYEVMRTKELLQELKNEGYRLDSSIREILKKEFVISNGQITKYESIWNKLISDFMLEFEEGNIDVTTAFELSQSDIELQIELLEEYKQGNSISSSRVREIREVKKKPQDFEIKVDEENATSVITPNDDRVENVNSNAVDNIIELDENKPPVHVPTNEPEIIETHFSEEDKNTDKINHYDSELSEELEEWEKDQTKMLIDDNGVVDYTTVGEELKKDHNSITSENAEKTNQSIKNIEQTDESLHSSTDVNLSKEYIKNVLNIERRNLTFYASNIKQHNSALERQKTIIYALEKLLKEME